MKHTLLMSVMPHLLMSAMAEGGEGAASTTTGTKIRPNLEQYQTAKSASGSSTKICGDDVSKALLGATLDEAYAFVAGVVGVPEADLRAKYGDKNLGQQRMFLGNLIRGGMVSKDAEKASRISKAFDAALGDFRVAVDTRVAADVAASDKIKAGKKAERDDKAAQAKKVKDEAKAKVKADNALKAEQKSADKKANDQLKADGKKKEPAAPAKAPAKPKETL